MDLNTFSVRYCASCYSIPEEAYDVLPIYVNGSSFNDNTGLEYGFSYKISKEYDIVPLCKLEKDILMENFTLMKSTELQPEKYDNYYNFVSYYDDECFELSDCD